MDTVKACCPTRKKHEDEGDAPVVLDKGAFTLLLDGTTGGVEITHCPWCGKMLVPACHDNQE